MKRLILFVFVSMIVSSNLLGQSLPTAVDNSQWFPPVRTQYWNSCQPYSIVYYLKSYLWNKQFQRDPSLLVNQFNPYFVWNQVIFPIGHWTASEPSFDFLSKQGCATAEDFPFVDNPSPAYQELMPSLQVREKALSFRSSDMKNIRSRSQDSVGAAAYIAQLKDSLAHGKCFAISFPLFHYIEQLYVPSLEPAVYECFPGISADSMYGTHQATVVGYDDNLHAFKVVNSWGTVFGDDGYFYLDYKWLYLAPWFPFDVYFLYEDFDHQSELSLNLSIRDYINGEDILFRKNIIIDTIYFNASLQRFVDFPDSINGILFPNLTRILEVNGKRVHDNKTNSLIPTHNHNGSYELISDLSDYSDSDSLHAVSVIIFDPKSGLYRGNTGNTIYEYQRVPMMSVEDSYIRFKATGKAVHGQIHELSDTTVIVNNYWSNYLALYTPSGSTAFISQSTCTFRRILVTFTDALNAPPVLVTKPDTLLTSPDSIVTFQFEAYDPDGDSVRYSVSGDSGASINSVTGLFSYKSSRLGSYDLTIMITDGSNAVMDSFIVRVDNTVGVDDDPFAIPTQYSLSQNYPNPFNPTTAINFSLPKSGNVTLKVYDLLGREVATLVDEFLVAGAHNTKFDASNLASGIYIYVVKTKDFSATKKMILMK